MDRVQCLKSLSTLPSAVTYATWETVGLSNIPLVPKQFLTRLKNLKKRLDAFTPHTSTEEMVALLSDYREAVLDIGIAAGSRLPPLCFAAQLSDAPMVEFLIEKGCDVNAVDLEKAPPIWIAANKYRDESGPSANEAVIELLAAAKANIDAKQDMYTPLTLAAARGCARSTATFLALDADPNILMEGRPCLSYAAINGHTEVAKLLIENKADINKKDAQGLAPLEWAIASEQVSMVKILLDAGVACGRIYTESSKYPHSEKASVIQALLRQALFREQQTINVEIEENKEKQTLQHIENLSKEAGVNGANILHIAARKCKASEFKDIFDTLKKNQNFNVDVTDSHGDTPLIYAARRADDDIALQLLEAGANINHANQRGLTPVIEAIRWNNRRTVGNLLNHGALLNLNHRIDKSETVKGLLSQRRNLDISICVENAVTARKLKSFENEPVEQASCYPLRFLFQRRTATVVPITDKSLRPAVTS